ncbi:MAG: hypothetical protein RLZZ32_102 [Cyanobacteriota bacterium]
MARRRLWLLPLLLPLLAWPGFAQSQVQLSCSGTLVEARGSAELKRTTQRLRFSLALEAEGADSDLALASLQRRLAAVRSGLQALQVSDLQVTSPSTWKRPASRDAPELVQANLQVSGQLAPARLQALVRQVGGLPGVRLAPVATEADAAGDRSARRQLLRAAYQDAQLQAQDVAAAMGLRQLQPLEVLLDGGSRPVPMRAMAMADAAVPPFDPGELPGPMDRLSLQVRFCAR